MSAATIDRYLAPAGARAVRGRSTAKDRSRPARLHQDPQGRWAQAPAGRPRTPPGWLLDTDAPADAQKDELIDYGRH